MENEKYINSIKQTILNYIELECKELPEIYELVKNRMNSICIRMCAKADFNNIYMNERKIKNNEIDVPIAFGIYSTRTIYLQENLINDSDYIVSVIHEILHILSLNKWKNKAGFHLANENNDIGVRFNECATVLLSEMIAGKNDTYTGYSIFLRNTFRLFLKTTGITNQEFIKLYFQEENWLTTELAKRFNKYDLNSLKKFVILFEPDLNNPNRKTNLVELLSNSMLINEQNNNQECIDLMAAIVNKSKPHFR